MSPQVDSSTQTPDQAPIADPIDQARQLVNMLSRNELIKQTASASIEHNYADDRTLVLAAVGIAIAHHLSRVADALEQRYAPLPF